MAKKKVTTKVLRDEKAIVPLYQVTFNTNESIQNVEGDTLKEAFDQLKGADAFVTLGELTVKKGDKTFTINLNVPKLRNFFNDETFRQIIIDNFDLALA